MVERTRLNVAAVILLLPALLPAFALFVGIKEAALFVRDTFRTLPSAVRYVAEPVGPALRRFGRAVRSFLVLDVYARFLAVLLIPVTVSLWLLARVIDIRGTKAEASALATELVQDTFKLLYRGAHFGYFETAQDDRIEVARREVAHLEPQSV